MCRFQGCSLQYIVSLCPEEVSASALWNYLSITTYIHCHRIYLLNYPEDFSLYFTVPSLLTHTCAYITSAFSINLWVKGEGDSVTWDQPFWVTVTWLVCASRQVHKRRGNHNQGAHKVLQSLSCVANSIFKFRDVLAGWLLLWPKKEDKRPLLPPKM